MLMATNDGWAYAEWVNAPMLVLEGDDVLFADFPEHVRDNQGTSALLVRVWKFDLPRVAWEYQGPCDFPYGHRFELAPDKVRRLVLEGRELPSADMARFRARCVADTDRRAVHNGAERVTVNGTVYRHVTNSVRHDLRNDAGEPVTAFHAHADNGSLTYVTVSDNDTVKVG